MEKGESLPAAAAAASRGGRLLKLPDINPFQSGLNGVRKEYLKETVAHHAYLMIGELEAPNMGKF